MKVDWIRSILFFCWVFDKSSKNIVLLELVGGGVRVSAESCFGARHPVFFDVLLVSRQRIQLCLNWVVGV